MRNYTLKFFFLVALAALISSCSSMKKSSVPNYIGTWTYSVDTPQGTTEGYLTITQDEKELIGLIGSDMGETPLANFEVSEESVRGTFDFEGYTVELSGTFEDNVLDGLMSVSGYDLPFKANKKLD